MPEDQQEHNIKRDRKIQGTGTAMWFWLLHVATVVRLRNFVLFLKKRVFNLERV